MNPTPQHFLHLVSGTRVILPARLLEKCVDLMRARERIYTVGFVVYHRAGVPIRGELTFQPRRLETRVDPILSLLDYNGRQFYFRYRPIFGWYPNPIGMYFPVRYSKHMLHVRLDRAVRYR